MLTTVFFFLIYWLHSTFAALLKSEKGVTIHCKLLVAIVNFCLFEWNWSGILMDSGAQTLYQGNNNGKWRSTRFILLLNSKFQSIFFICFSICISPMSLTQGTRPHEHDSSPLSVQLYPPQPMINSGTWMKIKLLSFVHWIIYSLGHWKSVPSTYWFLENFWLSRETIRFSQRVCTELLRIPICTFMLDALYPLPLSVLFPKPKTKKWMTPIRGVTPGGWGGPERPCPHHPGG